MLSKEQYHAWKHDPVTRALEAYILTVVETTKEGLASDAGINPQQDRYFVGGVAALRDVLEWKPEFSEGDD